MSFGKGFKLNIIEKIEESETVLAEKGYPYRYIDADGTVHYFKSTGAADQYCYEFDENVILTKDLGYTLTNPSGISETFNGEGYLTKTVDANGNPTSYRGYSMVWTKGRQLAAMSDTQTTLSFKYDQNGIRSSKTVNGTKTVYTYVGDRLISQKTGSEAINFAYTNSGTPYGFTYNGASYFYLLNLQGDVIGIYDNTGTVVVKYAYDAWGKLISTTGSLASTIGVKNPIRYRGYYYDTETGLYYLQSRYYDPETCRFVNADSLLIAGDYLQGTNMYAYCLNNPVMYVDPSGYEALQLSPSLWYLNYVFLLIDIINILFGSSLSEPPNSYNTVDITDKLNDEMRKNAEILNSYKEEHGYIEAVLFLLIKLIREAIGI